MIILVPRIGVVRWLIEEESVYSSLVLGESMLLVANCYVLLYFGTGSLGWTMG